MSHAAPEFAHETPEETFIRNLRTLNPDAELLRVAEGVKSELLAERKQPVQRPLWLFAKSKAEPAASSTGRNRLLKSGRK